MSAVPSISGREGRRPRRGGVPARVLSVLLAAAVACCLVATWAGVGRGAAVEPPPDAGKAALSRQDSSAQDRAASSVPVTSPRDDGADGVVSGIRAYADGYAADAPVLAVVAQGGQVVATYSRLGDQVSSSAVADGEVRAAAASRRSPDGSSSAEAASRTADGSGSADGDAGPASSADLSGAGEEVVGARVSDLSGQVAERTQLTTTSVVEWGRASDLLVWASVMLLAEDGKVDLEGSVRSLLPQGIDLPQGYSSVSMMDLMNHTTGLNVSATSALPSSSDGRSIVDELGTYQSVGAYESGELVAYSSYDVALAAAVVEQVSGMDICSFIEQNVLDPLGMTNTALSAGLSASRMAQSADERTARVASQVATVTSEARSVTFIDAVRSLTSNATDASVTGSIDGSALTCLSSMEDMAKLAAALVAPADAGGLFGRDDTAREMFATTRTFPGLGTRRCAHGMFALPTVPRAVGCTGPSSGVTAAVYMDLDSDTVAVVLVGVGSRAGLAQGLAGAALRPFVEAGPGLRQGRADEEGAPAGDAHDDPSDLAAGDGDGLGTTASLSQGQPAEDPSSEQAPTAAGAVDWSGVYQDAAQPIEGPSKLLGFFERTVVRYDARTDRMTVNGVPAKSLGRGVYVTQEPSGNDPYRFHVETSRGLEFSRTTGDSYAIPALTLGVERAIVALAVAAALASLGVFVGSVLSAARARLAGLRWAGQPSCLVLSAATTCAGVWTAASMLAGNEAFLATMPVERVLNAGYVAVAALLAVWLCVTRWRGTARGRGKILLAALCIGCAAVMSVFFVYWDLLP